MAVSPTREGRGMGVGETSGLWQSKSASELGSETLQYVCSSVSSLIPVSKLEGNIFFNNGT